LRRRFELASRPEKAHLLITALGVYEAWINGRRVGQDELRPGWTDYGKRLPVQVYDVTAHLRSGCNCLGAWLGDGWCCGKVGPIDRGVLYEAQSALRAALAVTDAAGTKTVVVSDEAWSWHEGPILADDLIDGEHYDARREVEGWCDACPPESADEVPGWRSAALLTPRREPAAWVVSAAPPVRVTQRLRPVADPQPGAGSWGRSGFLFDLGQNFTGKVELRVTGPRGLTLMLRFAEVLTVDGRDLDRRNLRTAQATDCYTLKGDPAGETWSPRFTFHGFRYAQIQYDNQAAASSAGVQLQPFTRDTLTGLVMHNDLPRIGQFETGHALLNRLQENIVWGQRSNFLEAPTDCPQRDERLGWVGDAQVFAPTAAFNFDVSGFFAKWLDDLADSQLPDGQIPSVAPNVLEQRDSAAGWSDVVVLVPWAMMRAYGDRAQLARHYPMMKRWIDFQCRTARDGTRGSDAAGLFTGFGDWLALDGEGSDPFQNLTPKMLIGTAYHAHTLSVFADLADRLGHTTDAQQARLCRDRAVAAFQREFVRDGQLTVASQTAHLMALAFDLLPDAQRAGVFADLLALLAAHDHHLTTGFLGTPLWCPVLSRFGRTDLAYNLLLTTTYPGWLYPVTLGATTMWERWNSWHPEQGFVDLSMNSLNHYAYGAVGDWMYRHIAGIQLDLGLTDQPRLDLRPCPDVRLGHCRASLRSPAGMIESRWAIQGQSVRYQVSVPAALSATFAAPGQAPLTLEPGPHHFEYPLV
jgi:alpha-L-rhamnosidase